MAKITQKTAEVGLILEDDPTLRDKFFRKLNENNPWAFRVTNYNRIPFRDENYEGSVIVPRSIDSEKPQEIEQDLIRYQEKLKELKTYAPNPESQKKYQNSIEFIEHCIKPLRTFRQRNK